MFEKAILSSSVQKAIVEEHEKVRAELREKGPEFDLTSIKPRLKRAKEMAEAEEAAAEKSA